MRELILQKLNEAQISMSAASLRIGRNASYLQQFLHRGVPTELREREREKLAEMLGLDQDQLRGSGSPPLSTRPYSKQQPSVARSARLGAKSIPPRFIDTRFAQGSLAVYATVQNTAGVFSVSSKPISRRARPDFLEHNDDAYGLVVSGDAMDPEAKNGSTALIDPHKPPQEGDTCVFRSAGEDGGTQVVIRQLVKQNARQWTVHQHKPSRTYTLPRSEWPVCHSVVGNYSR